MQCKKLESKLIFQPINNYKSLDTTLLWSWETSTTQTLEESILKVQWLLKSIWFENHEISKYILIEWNKSLPQLNWKGCYGRVVTASGWESEGCEFKPWYHHATFDPWSPHQLFQPQCAFNEKNCKVDKKDLAFLQLFWLGEKYLTSASAWTWKVSFVLTALFSRLKPFKLTWEILNLNISAPRQKLKNLEHKILGKELLYPTHWLFSF